MSHHLSQDQMSRFLLGEASPEEEEHGRDCSECRAELIRFTDALSTFQGVMKDWSESETVPRLEEAATPLAWRRWVVAGVAVAILASIPIYEFREREPGPVSRANADELLMQEVAAQLSRPLPMSMERVIVLLPDVPEREEVQ